MSAQRGLFDPPVNDADLCPHCGREIIRISVDTGTPMHAEVQDDGPYVMDGDVLRFLNGQNEVLHQGQSQKKLRKASKDEPRYGSHFATCPKRERWQGILKL